MENTYALEWFDLLINVTLNPQKGKATALSKPEIDSVLSIIESEGQKFELSIKNQVFALTKEGHIELLVKQYHHALIVLLDNLHENKKRVKDDPGLTKIFKAIHDCLEELLAFMEARFCFYGGFKKKVPIERVEMIRGELERRLSALSGSDQEESKHEAVDIFIGELSYALSQAPLPDGLTYDRIVYLRELITGVEEMLAQEITEEMYSPLDTFLISNNFNSKRYVRLLIEKATRALDDKPDSISVLDELLLQYKKLSQMQIRECAKLYPDHNNLHADLTNWFAYEIEYYDRRLHANEDKYNGLRSISVDRKISSMLSVDQLALLLRAANDLKVLMSRSLNALFKSIAPFLSTPHQQDISYDSMRSKSYSAERRDKEIVIQMLQQMIKRVEEY